MCDASTGLTAHQQHRSPDMLLAHPPVTDTRRVDRAILVMTASFKDLLKVSATVESKEDIASCSLVAFFTKKRVHHVEMDRKEAHRVRRKNATAVQAHMPFLPSTPGQPYHYHTTDDWIYARFEAINS